MSWNAGGGAKKMSAVLEEVGNHIIAVQEAHANLLQAPPAHARAAQHHPFPNLPFPFPHRPLLRPPPRP
eukprot:3218661-Alexandrium_andersonii.AAC.1